MRARPLLFTLIVIFLLASTTFAADTQILTGPEYFQTTLQAIQQAKKSILVAMYLINVSASAEDNPASILLESLISAKNRGVNVKVILDNSQSVNYKAYNRLKQNGVDVSFDAPLKLLHGKAIIIDSEISIFGSYNWTRAALNDNHEFATYIEGKEEAAKLINYISKIALGPEPAEPKDEPGLKFPVSALTLMPKPSLFNVFTSQAGQAFNLYLFLAKKAQETGSDLIAIDYYEFAGKGLGYFKKERIDIYRVLRKLDKKYGLIRYKPGGKDLNLIKISSLSYITIPDTYWEYQFDRKLSLAGKYMYLVALSEAQKSILNSSWFRSQKDLTGMYHISSVSISNGLNELQRENIIEIYRNKPEAPGKFDSRLANSYRLNPLQDPEQFSKAIKAFSEKYGPDITKQACELSNQLNEPKDLEKIETYIQLINSYGYEKVSKVNSHVASYRRETGFRDLSQVILILRGT